MKRLIVNADDFGWTRGITDGILLAHRDGLVTSTTLLADQPASEYALEQARCSPSLGVGVHLNLCQGRPVLPPGQVPSLVDSGGAFFPIAELRNRLRRGEIRGRDVEAEFRAQIRWMKERGFPPTHADSHHHLHMQPRLLGAFRSALLAEGVRCARGARLRCCPYALGGAHAGPFPRRVAVQLYLDAIQRFGFRHITLPDFRLAIHPRYRGRPDSLEEAWQEALAALPSGSFELGCHPGVWEDGYSERDNLREVREAELRALTSPRVRAAVNACSVQLINYSSL